MTNRHHVTNELVSIGGERIFTDAGWNLISPRIDRMPEDGGCITIILDARPMERNYLDVQVASFGPDERTAIRTAIAGCRKRRSKSA